MPVFIVKPWTVIVSLMILVSFLRAPGATAMVLAFVLIVWISVKVHRHMENRRFREGMMSLAEKGKVP